MNRIHKDFCLNDEVYYTDNVSVVLTIDGEPVYLVNSYDDYLILKKRVTVTHRIEALDLLVPGMYYCDMLGSDGSKLSIVLTDEDVHHNLQYVENQFSIQHVQMIA